MQTLTDLIDDYPAWRDGLPASFADSDVAQRLEDLLQLRDLVDQLAAADLPKGFGRDWRENAPRTMAKNVAGCRILWSGHGG